MDRYQCLKLVYSDRLSSFFTKLSKNNMGGGVMGTHNTTTPHTHHPTHPPPPTHPTHDPPHHHPPQEPSNHPPWRKSGALMPDISWAAPHSLPTQ